MAKILIVDDAAFMRKVIRDTLTKNGFTDLHEAVDGKDAVEKYFELQPDLSSPDRTDHFTREIRLSSISIHVIHLGCTQLPELK